nr:unnamed protein product [Spirometra erinaceieuropaei]
MSRFEPPSGPRDDKDEVARSKDEPGRGSFWRVAHDKLHPNHINRHITRPPMSLRRPLPPATNLPEISGQEGSGPKVLSAPVTAARRASVYTSGQSEGQLNCFGHFQSQFSGDADQESNRADETVDFKLGRRTNERVTDISGGNLTLEAGSALFQKQNDSCFRRISIPTSVVSTASSSVSYLAPLPAPQDASSRTKRQLVRKPVAEDEDDEQGCADLNSYFSRLYSIVFSQSPDMGSFTRKNAVRREEAGVWDCLGSPVPVKQEVMLPLKLTPETVCPQN